MGELQVSEPVQPAEGEPTDESPADESPAEESPEPRRYPSTLGGALYLVVLAATALGIGLAWVGDWRLGVTWVGASLIAAALLRLVLRQRDAGMLAVRHRAVDVLLLTAVGGVLIFLAGSIPNQPMP